MVLTSTRLALSATLLAGVILTAHAQTPVTPGTGTLKKIDAQAGTVTIEVPVKNKKKKDESEKEYLLTADAVVTITVEGVKKELTGKDALASGVLKEGDSVTFKAVGDLKIVELTVNPAKKKK